MCRVLTLVFLAGHLALASAQKFAAVEGSISFYSSAPLEDIKAGNQKVSSLFDVSSGEIAYSVPINQFQFSKKLMQEHFNDKYMESHKFPKATFLGRLQYFDSNISVTQTVTAVGKLTIHGVTRDIRAQGTIERKGNNLEMRSSFQVRLEDYKIKIPTLMWQNIAEEVEVTVHLLYKPQ